MPHLHQAQAERTGSPPIQIRRQTNAVIFHAQADSPGIGIMRQGHGNFTAAATGKSAFDDDKRSFRIP